MEFILQGLWEVWDKLYSCLYIFLTPVVLLYYRCQIGTVR